MNQRLVPLITTGLVSVSIVLGAPGSPIDPSLTKAAVRECSRSFYQLGRDLMEVPQLEVHDPKRFFELIYERIDDQRALIAIIRERAKEETTISALVAADRALHDARKALRDVGTKDKYGEIAFSIDSSRRFHTVAIYLYVRIFQSDTSRSLHGRASPLARQVASW